MTGRGCRAPARTVELQAAAGAAPNGPPWSFSGIAVAAGDVLRMADGTRVLMSAEELRKAARTQADEPVTVDHPEDDDGQPLYPPPTDETVGKVHDAGWIESAQAVGYDAATHDPNIAQGIQGGSLDVSVHPFFDVEPYDGPEADVVARNIKFGDLSVVAKGDSPSATAEWGPNQALASAVGSVDVRAELTAAATPTVEDDLEGVIELLVDEHDFDRESLESASDDDLSTIASAVLADGALGPDATLDDVAAAIGDRLVTKEEFEAMVDERIDEIVDVGDGDGEATGGLSTEEEERLEAYGTGLDEHGQEQLEAKGDRIPQAERLRQEAIAEAGADDDADVDYGTGVQESPLDGPTGGTWHERRQELQAAADECDDVHAFAIAIGEDVETAQELIARNRLEVSFPDDPERYGTGVSGGD